MVSLCFIVPNVDVGVLGVIFTDDIRVPIASKVGYLGLVSAHPLADKVGLEGAVAAVLEDELSRVLVVVVIRFGNGHVEMTVAVEICDLQAMGAVQVVPNDSWLPLRCQTNSESCVIGAYA